MSFIIHKVPTKSWQTVGAVAGNSECLRGETQAPPQVVATPQWAVDAAVDVINTAYHKRDKPDSDALATIIARHAPKTEPQIDTRRSQVERLMSDLADVTAQRDKAVEVLRRFGNIGLIETGPDGEATAHGELLYAIAEAAEVIADIEKGGTT